MRVEQKRFVSVREGPNLRQAFDDVVAEFVGGSTIARAFVTQPLPYRSSTNFDDARNGRLRFDGILIEQRAWGPGDFSVYLARYGRDEAHVAGASGDERRAILDARYFRGRGPLQFDVEGMLQRGSIAERRIPAWAFRARTRYTFADVALHPAMGLQFDAASGDRGHPNGPLRSFNPLFSNGLYFRRRGSPAIRTACTSSPR